MTNWFLPVPFYFKVTFELKRDKKSDEKPNAIGEVAFKKVSGLNIEMELESIKEGGLNTHEHKLPKALKHQNLKLERAIMPIESNLGAWIKESLEGDFSTPIKVCNVLIKLLNEDGEPMYIWVCEDAYPVKWEFGEFDALKNEIAIEVLELSFSTLKRSN